MNQQTQQIIKFFDAFQRQHAARASRGERVLVDAGTLRKLSAAHGASSLRDVLSGWEQDGDVIILGDWETLPEDAPGIEFNYE
jgi:hypothetical protein